VCVCLCACLPCSERHMKSPQLPPIPVKVLGLGFDIRFRL